MSRIALSAAVSLLCLFPTLASGVVPDPQIMTDHPVYRGELACSTLDRNIADAYRVFTDRYGHPPATDTEKLLALFAWKSEHYMHACDNKVYVGPDNPDANAAKDPPWLGRDGWMDNKDCQMNQFSFSFALCYSVHAHMAVLVGRALGDMRRVRCPEITGHTPFEAYVDGRWVVADCTMGLMVFDDAARAIGLDEIYARIDTKDKEWFASPARGGPYKFDMSPFGDRLDSYSRVRWQQPLFGYNAMPIVYSLRAGESFTRYLDPGLDDGKTWMFWGRDYFGLNGKPRHGPYRNVTFLDDYPIGNGRKGRGKAYYGNGVFEYVPPLGDGRYKQGVKDSNELTYKDNTLRGRKAGAFVTFEHAGPYIIAARTVEDGDTNWNVLKDKCRDGAVVSGAAAGNVPVKVSVDAGRTWTDVGTAAGDFHLDFTDAVKGRHEYLLRFELAKDAGLKSLKMRTVTQVGRGVFPRLKDGGTSITYEASNQAVIHGGPSQYLAEPLRRKDLETEGHRVYQLKAPGPVRHASGAARVNGPKSTSWTVDFSLDGGKTWQVGARDLQATGDGKLWEQGQAAYAWAEMDFPKNKSKEVLVRFGKGTILHAQVFATYETKNASPLTVTYNWTEGDEAQTKEHTHKINAGQGTDTWTIPTGQKVKTKWVRFTAD